MKTNIATVSALKTENLPIQPKEADSILDAMRTFLENVGFSSERISELECRRRDGFIPHSHNFGGLEAIAFADQFNVLGMGGTGFSNADFTLESYKRQNMEMFAEDRKISSDRNDWTDEQHQDFDEWCMNDSESTVLYSIDLMHTGIERGIHSLNIRMCISVKDAPYHREYDDLISIDLTFRNAASLEKKLEKLLKRSDFKQLSKLLREAF